MRIAAWALVTLAGVACSRRSLQGDDGGGGPIAFDAAGDAVGSADGGVGLPDGTVPIPDATCGVLTMRSEKLPIDMLLVVDRSMEGDPAAWNELVATLASLTTARNDGFAWALKLFPEDGPGCGAGSVTNEIDVPFTFRNAATINAALSVATPTHDGTPTAAAIEAGRAYLQSVGDINPKYLMLVTDGAPTCAGTAGAPVNDAAQALADAVAAAAANLAAGTPTFVVGVGVTTARDVDALNKLARAGGYPRANPIEFFPAASVDELILALTPSSSYTCTLSLAKAPPNTEVVTVTVNGAVFFRDVTHQNGWDYTDSTRSTLTLYGSACELIPNSWVLEVQIAFACTLPMGA